MELRTRLNELPGAELILPGLDDIHNGKTSTIGALLVAIAATRLSTAGLAIPKDNLAPEPELTLYNQLEAERDDAYPYYNALLARLHSFCHALELRDWVDAGQMDYDLDVAEEELGDRLCQEVVALIHQP